MLHNVMLFEQVSSTELFHSATVAKSTATDAHTSTGREELYLIRKYVGGNSDRAICKGICAKHVLFARNSRRTPVIAHSLIFIN